MSFLRENGQEIIERPELLEPTSSDIIPIRDFLDLTDGAFGTDKYIRLVNLKQFLTQAFGTAAQMDGPVGSIVGTSDAQALTKKVMTGVKETKGTSVSYNFDLDTANYFTHTASPNNLTVSNVPPAGTVGRFILELTDGGAFSFSFWSGVKWDTGTPPALTVSGVDILSFYTYDGGVTWRGLMLSRDSK